MEYTTNDYAIFDTLVNYMYVEMNKRFWDKTTPIIFSHIDTNKTVDLCATIIARNYCALVSQPFYVDMNLFQYWKFCRKYGWKIKRAHKKAKKQGQQHHGYRNPERASEWLSENREFLESLGGLY